MRQPEVGEGLLDRRLAAEVRVRRVGVGVSDRYVYHPAHAGLGGRLEQHARPGHGDLVADLPVREAHPVGVDQRPGAAQRLGESGRIGEVQRPDLDRGARGCAAGMAGEGPDPASRRLQFAGDNRSGVAERPGHHVEVGHGSAATRSVSTRPRGASSVAAAYASPRVAPWLTITTGTGTFAACRTYRKPDITVSEDSSTTSELACSTMA